MVARFFGSMIRFGVVLAVLGSLTAAAATVPEFSGGVIRCPGEYAGHLQGLATDGKAIYWSFTRALVKTDFAGKLLKRVDAPRHCGDPCWSDGKLYVPLCEGSFNRKLKPGERSKNFVCEFDADLKLLARHHIPDLKYGAGAIAEHGGHFFVAGGRPKGKPGNTVYEYDRDFKLLKRHESDFDSRSGIQTINRAFGKWYFGCYGPDRQTIETDDAFRVTRRLRPSVAVGMIPLGNDRVLRGAIKRIAPGKTGAFARAVRLKPAARLSPGDRVDCPGEYRGHLQGIATDGKAIYWSFTRALVKTDLDGKLLKRVDAPRHCGDPCRSDDKLYVPLCEGSFNRELPPGAESANYILVFDTDLKLLTRHHIPDLKYGAGAVAEHGGHFFVAGGRPKGMPGNTVYEYDRDFKLLKRHEIDFDSDKGIQTINRAFGKWYFGCYGTDGQTVETDDAFRVTRRLRPGSALGLAVLPDDVTVVGELAQNGSYRRGGAAVRAVEFRAAETPPNR